MTANLKRAEPVKIGCIPSPSVPAETVMQDGWNTFLLFFAGSEERNTDGRFDDLGVAVVECIECASAKMGYPNDEGLPEHPLYSEGIASGATAYRLAESAWLSEIKEQMKKSHERIWARRGRSITRRDPELFHFVVPLKEKTFECVARQLEVKGYYPTFDDAFLYVRDRFREH